MFEIINDSSAGPVIKVIGVGGAGGNAVDHMIEQGVEGVDFFCIADRQRAILHAVRLAGPGDVVIICGKGHEQSMCFGVTEPNSGLDTSSLETRAERTNSGYTINGRKIWTTGAQRADKILLIARTTPKDKVAKAYMGLSLFYMDMKGVEAKPIPKMGRKAVECNMLYFDNVQIPREALIGEEDQGFKYLLQGLNPERVLFAVEAIGLGHDTGHTPFGHAGEQALDDAPLVLTGHTLVNCRFSVADVRREADGRTYHALVRFRAVTEPTT